MIDIHTHVLPGIDDGAGDINVSINICSMAEKQGVTTILAAPHYWPGIYQPSWENIINKTNLLNEELQKKGLEVEILPGMEVHLDMDVPIWLEKGIIGTLNNTGKYLLVELPVNSIPHYTEMVLCKLLSMGVIPILAHPERNGKIIANPRVLYNWLDKGVLVQITAGSLTGAFGRRVERTSKLLLEHNWVHFIASDCHDTDKRPYIFKEGLSAAEAIVGEEKAQALVLENPIKVIKGESIPTAPKEFNLAGNKKKGNFYTKLIKKISGILK
ncbi:MAG: phosphotransferase [Desulfotomaculum sp.]|nr:phosphotransferase [Desulfotomaculum sp.]